jgi:hypothetical protein
MAWHGVLNLVALSVVVLAGLYLVALGAGAWRAPARVVRFLGGFAGSARVHYLELALRLAVGAAMLLAAPVVRHPAVFTGFGWILVATTLVLAAVPWRLHRRFADRTVPSATRHLPLIAIASCLLGVLLLGSVALGHGR